jgi:hypothetical protein
MLGLLYVLYWYFHFAFCRSIFVVTLSTISFKFMQGGKYMHFASIGFYSIHIVVLHWRLLLVLAFSYLYVYVPLSCVLNLSYSYSS